MDTQQQETFAREWIDAWNAHDLERILSFYSEDAEMQSEYIEAIASDASGILVGKDRLRAYWGEALRRLPDLHFTHIVTCSGIDTVAIHYRSVGDRLAIEVFRFDDQGLIRQAAAHYAKALPRPDGNASHDNGEALGG